MRSSSFSAAETKAKTADTWRGAFARVCVCGFELCVPVVWWMCKRRPGGGDAVPVFDDDDDDNCDEPVWIYLRVLYL